MQYIRFIGIFLFITLLSPSTFADSLKLGIFPYLSAGKLLKIHNPLASYLSENLNSQVNLISAPGFGQFIQRTKKQKYDIIITAPHMGALALLQSNYQRLAVSSNKSHAVFVSLNKSKFNSFKNIQQASITLPPEKAIITKLALQTLSEQDSNINELNIEYTQSHNNALKSVLIGESDVAAFGFPTWNRTSDVDKSRLQVLGASEGIPGFMIVANASMSQQKIQKITRLLLNFHHTDKGKAYFKTTRLEPFRAITEQDIEDLKPFVKSIFNFE